MIDLIPTNEAETIHIFSKYHKHLGFDKILKIQSSFPDIIAYRNNKLVKIEMEYKLSRFKNHYLAFNHGYYANEFRWREDKKQWWTFNTETNDWTRNNYKTFTFKDNLLKNKNDLKVVNGHLHYVSLKSQCDLVICWIADIEIEPEIQVIELEKKLREVKF